MSSTQSSFALLKEDDNDTLLINDESHASCEVSFIFNSSSDSYISDSNNKFTKIMQKTLKKKKKSRKNTEKELQQSHWSTLNVKTNANYHTQCLCCKKNCIDKSDLCPKDIEKKTFNYPHSNKSQKASFENKPIPKEYCSCSNSTNRNPLTGNSIPVSDSSEYTGIDEQHLIETFHNHENIFSSLDDLNLININEEKKASSNITDPLTITNMFIEKQIEFFRRLSHTLNTFVNCHNYTLFKLNNNLNLESNFKEEHNSYFYKFEEFEEFLKYSEPIRKWLKKHESGEYESALPLMQKNGKEKNQRIIKIESELNQYKIKLDLHANEYNEFKKKNKEYDIINGICNSCIAVNSGSTPNDTNNLIILTNKKEQEAEKNYDDIVKKYEQRIELLLTDNQNLMVKNQSLINKLNLFNSKEYKTIKKNTYESLKFQLKLYKEDYKLEHKEKEQFQRECLELEKKLEKNNNLSHNEFDY